MCGTYPGDPDKPRSPHPPQTGRSSLCFQTSAKGLPEKNYRIAERHPHTGRGIHLKKCPVRFLTAAHRRGIKTGSDSGSRDYNSRFPDSTEMKKYPFHLSVCPAGLLVYLSLNTSRPFPLHSAKRMAHSVLTDPLPFALCAMQLRGSFPPPSS